MLRAINTLAIMLSITLSAVGVGKADETARVDYSRDIQPLLAERCVVCHGPDDAESGLRLDLRDWATREVDSGSRAIVPGDLAKSELIARVTSHDEYERMPPEGDPLSEQEVSLLKRWIQQGAEYDVHWAYQPVDNPEPPSVDNAAWNKHPIDRFVFARLEQNQIRPSPQAVKTTLIKRLYYDLIGLPPKPNEVDAFLKDDSEAAYESLVDQLLASPHFGERWGRHWLDKARYADSDGYEKDRPRMNAWRYRDWVINAINNDMPFDQFTIEQLAGDLLPQPSKDQLLATAFHRQTLTNTEGGTDKEQFRVEATFDRTETTASVWMGLTMTCARCHTHKYDQISQREYYQLFSFFNTANETNFAYADSDEEYKKYLAAKSEHAKEVAELSGQYEAALQELKPEVEAWAAERTRLIKSSRPVQFHATNILESFAHSDATLQTLEDGSLLVSGSTPDVDTYEIVFAAPELPVTGLKLEALTHETLPSKGPGRTAHGNFVLSELVTEVVPANPKDAKPTRLKFHAATTSFSQNGFSGEGVLSDKPKSGWAIAPKMGNSHELICSLESPVEIASDEQLRVTLKQDYGGKHTLGRIRISWMSGVDPLKSLPKEVAGILKKEASKRSQAEQRKLAEHVGSRMPEVAKLGKQLTDLKQKAPKDPRVSVRVMGQGNRETKLLHRGDFLQPEEAVQPAHLDVLDSVHPLEPGDDDKLDRLDLARWLVDAQHPITPRVTVNHVWSKLFGEGLVRTVNDFGVRGERPTHPELLDWLAYQFPRDLGWSRKELIRLIVTSETYKQSSNHRPELVTIDATNRLLARQNRIRVEAEIVRDLCLSASGLLSPKVGGPSVYPPLPPGIAELSYANSFRWTTSKGDDRYRRGMYTFFKRTAPHPNLIGFDCPDANTTKLQRETSNTPLQALTTLNNAVFTEAAQAMATRVLREEADDHARLVQALRICIARQPTDDELQHFQDLLETARSYYKEHPDEAVKVMGEHASEQVPPHENAAWVVVTRVILNLDEFIVRG